MGDLDVPFRILSTATPGLLYRLGHGTTHGHDTRRTPLSGYRSDRAQLLAQNAGWGRSRLSVKLCKLWDWRAPNDQLKDMACRNLLLRLEKVGHITLPPRQRKSPNGYRNRSPVWVPHRTEPIERALKDLRPLQIACVVNASEHDRLFRCLLSWYHYLGLRNTAGENMKYLRLMGRIV